MAPPNAPIPTRVHDPRRAIVQMVSGGLFLTANDAASKWNTPALFVGEIIFLRGVFALLFLAVFVRVRYDWRQLRIVNWRGQLLRASVSAVSTVLFVFGLSLLPLAHNVSVMFAAPLFVAALAPALLGEHVGWRRWAAILVGFVGVIVLLRPSPAGIQWAALLPLGSAFLGALRDILTRRISVTETSLAILFYSMLAETLVGGALLAFGWAQPDWLNLGTLALGGALFVVSQFLFIEAFRNAEAAVVAPFRYTLLISASFWGYVIWGDVPDEWTLSGAAIIIASGLYILYRETRSRRAPPLPP